MKRTCFLLLLFTSCFLPATIIAQSFSPWPKTLLWRISGNGLSENSYLFGSMHLQDKRLFYFGDSLYYYLDQAKGYALEVDLRELMDSVIQQAVNDKTDELVDKKRLNRGNEKKKIVDSLLHNVLERNDKASRRQLKRLRDEKVRKAIKNKEMPTIIDAYLYGIARRKGKWLGGIEDVHDQLSLFDELGVDMTSDELTAPDAAIATTLEEMIRMYLAADLDAIEKYSNSVYSPDQEDRMLLKRNGKMAWRMDSLAHIRSMFFTVGAAHLPGESGVISLLRQKGYQVDPVFSSAPIDPDQYTSRLADIPWVKVEDDGRSYEVQMPGEASEFEMLDGMVTMKFYADITTLTYYMCGSMFAQVDDPSDLIKSWQEDTNGRLISQKKIERDGFRGIEGIMLSDNVYYKVQYLLKDRTLYMLMAGSAAKDAIETPDVKKFFASFVAREAPPAIPKDWSVFSLEEKACTVLFPGVPKRSPDMEKKAGSNDWGYAIYQYTDKEIYYMLQVRDIAPGYYLSGDSAYFSLCRGQYELFVDQATKDELTTVQSFPAFRYEGQAMKGKIMYKTLAINRGNRVYVLFAGGSNTPEAIADMERFVNSVELVPYKNSSWATQRSPEGDFHTAAPAPVVVFTSEEEGEEGQEPGDDRTYVAYDSSRVVSYQVYKTVVSPYFWVAGDSLFFEQSGSQYKRWNDSVLSKKAVSNGGLKGMDWLIEMPGNNNLKKFRQLLNGDTLYTLISFIPKQYIDQKEHQRFFDEFRATRENHLPGIYSSKAKKLLEDLASTDSATFASASAALGSAPFAEEDRPLLHDALLKNYIDDTLGAYYTSRQRIGDALSELADSTTIAFIRENFALQTGSREKIKFNLLNVLAKLRTGYSYSVLKQLLLEHTPAEKGNTELSYYITDSLQLARGLFPEILTLSNDDLFTERLIAMTAKLLDSNLVATDMLQPYRRNFLYTADTTLAALKGQVAEEDYYGYSYIPLLHLLQHFNDAESNRLLQQYLLLDDLMIKQAAAIVLLKNAQPVSRKELEKIAADKGYRRDLYDDLDKLEKLQLFPSNYLTQQYLAESDIYAYAYDEEEPEVNFIGKRDVTYKGEKKRFYLFRISYAYDEENKEESAADYQYLGIAGPYDMDGKKTQTGNEATGVFWKENFDAGKIDQQLAAYLKELQAREEAGE